MRPLVPLFLLFACNSSPSEPVPGTGVAATTPDGCWEGVGEFGIEVGNCAPDFTLNNHRDKTRSLSDQAGDIIIVDCSAMW